MANRQAKGTRGNRGNRNPYPGRLAKKRARTPGTLPQLQQVLWEALLHAQEVLEQAGEPELRLKAVHAISQTSGQYWKLLEMGELEARLTALEQRIGADR